MKHVLSQKYTTNKWNTSALKKEKKIEKLFSALSNQKLQDFFPRHTAEIFLEKYRSPTREMQIFFMIAFRPRALISLTLHDATMLSIKDTRSWKQ